MKLAVLLAVAVCYFQSRCVNTIVTSSETPMPMATPDPTPSMEVTVEPNVTESDQNTTEENTVTATFNETEANMTTTSDDTDSNTGGQSGLSTGAIVGIVVGVVVGVVLVTLLVTIVVVLSLKSMKSKAVVQISPTKASTKNSTPDAKLVSHGKSQTMKELPIVDSS